MDDLSHADAASGAGREFGAGPAAGPAVGQVSCRPPRDLRLDLLRGLGQWMIFLDHTPNNVVGWLTIHNYGFSDATEFFVFISGYCAGHVYGAPMRHGRGIAVTRRYLRRAWQLYLVHLFLVLLFTAVVALTALRSGDPQFEHQFNVFRFLQHPDVLIGQTLELRYKPVNLDVLPLFIVLSLASPPILWGIARRADASLLAAAAVYVCARRFGWNLPSVPQGTTWYFNPFAWQLMFVFGAWCACGGSRRLQPLKRSRTVLALAVAWLVFASYIAMTWHFNSLGRIVPAWVDGLLYPIGKPTMDPPRVIHFLAILVLVVRFLPRDATALSALAWRPLIVCGQNSLAVFCFGVLASFGAHWFLSEVDGGVVAQVFVSFAGIGLMVALAWAMLLYRNLPDVTDARGISS